MARNIKPWVTKDNVIKHSKYGFFVPGSFANQGGGAYPTGIPGHPELPPDDRLRACFAMEEVKEVVIECEIFWPKPKVSCWTETFDWWGDIDPDVPDDSELKYEWTTSVHSYSYRKCLLPWTVTENVECEETFDDGSPGVEGALHPFALARPHPDIQWGREPGPVYQTEVYTSDDYRPPVPWTGGEPDMGDGCQFEFVWLKSNYFRIRYKKEGGPWECCRPCNLLGGDGSPSTGNITETTSSRGERCECDSWFSSPAWRGEGSVPYEDHDDYCFPSEGFGNFICPNDLGFFGSCTGPAGFLFGQDGGGEGRGLESLKEAISNALDPAFENNRKYCSPCMQVQTGEEALADMLSEWKDMGREKGC